MFQSHYLHLVLIRHIQLHNVHSLLSSPLPGSVCLDVVCKGSACPAVCFLAPPLPLAASCLPRMAVLSAAAPQCCSKLTFLSFSTV